MMTARAFLLLLLSVASLLAADPDHEALQALMGQEGKLVAPPKVLKLADDWYGKQPAAVRGKLTEDACRREFARDFLVGFTEPQVTMMGNGDAGVLGLAAGKAYRAAHPDAFKEILTGYGYTAIEVDGVWKAGFEQSSFTSKKSPKGEWWITVVGEIGERLKGDERVFAERAQEGTRVHVSGYLSPLGTYGHMGQGRRELVALKIVRAPAE